MNALAEKLAKLTTIVAVQMQSYMFLCACVIADSDQIEILTMSSMLDFQMRLNQFSQ